LTLLRRQNANYHDNDDDDVACCRRPPRVKHPLSPFLQCAAQRSYPYDARLEASYSAI
jgi:hypothetical protein